METSSETTSLYMLRLILLRWCPERDDQKPPVPELVLITSRQLNLRPTTNATRRGCHPGRRLLFVSKRNLGFMLRRQKQPFVIFDSLTFSRGHHALARA